MRALAAVFAGRIGQHELRPLDVPRPRPGELLVRVLGATICGSDRHSFEGRRQVAVPTILGHEIVGRIEAFADDPPPSDLSGQPLTLGDRITWGIVAHCGDCFFCDHELPQKCEHAVKYGHEPLRDDYELHGGFAEYCLLAPGTSIMRLPDALPLEVACPANCATATSAAAVDAATYAGGTFNGHTVTILGAGLIGLTTASMAHSQGAANIIVVDPDEHRRQLAHQFGATHVADPASLGDLLGSLTRHGTDFLIEASGAAAAFTNAFPFARIGGSIVLVGSVSPGPDVPIALERIVRRNLRIVGVHNYAPKHLRQAVEFLAAAHTRHPFADLVADWFPIDQIDEAFAQARDPRKVRVGVRQDRDSDA